MGMNRLSMILGNLLILFGGCTALIGIIGFIGWLALMAWVWFSVTFRKILTAESLIVEFRKNREEFMAWKALKDEERKDNG
jgi:hypothetical protein